MTTRRQMLQTTGAGLMGLSLERLLQAEAVSTPRAGRAKSVIFLFLFGGPSQLETFDLKPNAPQEVRGPFQPIACRTPGLRISEHLPNLANLSDRFSVIRTMSHTFNDHSGGGHYVQTGHRWQIPVGAGFNATPQDWPSMGSVVQRLASDQATVADRNTAGEQVPGYMVVPNSLGRLQNYSIRLRRPGEYAGWMGSAFDPVTTKVEKTDANDNPYWRDMTDEQLTFAIPGMEFPEGVDARRWQKRLALTEQIGATDTIGGRPAYLSFRDRALDLLSSNRVQQALDVTQETESIRDTYGRHLFGQSTLVARRLVESGVRFVTVHYDCVDGYSWDSHRNSDDVKQRLLPTFDQACAALIEDLSARGLLDETLVIAMGEMGRTPKANSHWGRNHWSTLFPALLAGGGIRPGTVYGESDAHAAFATEQPVSPEDLAATVYSALGIDPETRIHDQLDRPVPLVAGGRPLVELFS